VKDLEAKIQHYKEEADQLKNYKAKTQHYKGEVIKLKNEIDKLKKNSEEKLKPLQDKIDHMKAQLPCVKILAYDYDMIYEFESADVKRLQKHFIKMDKAKQLKFVLFSHTKGSAEMKTNINKMFYDGGNEDHFSDLDVQYFRIDQDIVKILKAKFHDTRLNQFFFITTDKEPFSGDDREYHHYILKTFTNTDLKNIEKIMEMNQIICQKLTTK